MDGRHIEDEFEEESLNGASDQGVVSVQTPTEEFQDDPQGLAVQHSRSRFRRDGRQGEDQMEKTNAVPGNGRHPLENVKKESVPLVRERGNLVYKPDEILSEGGQLVRRVSGVVAQVVQPGQKEVIEPVLVSAKADPAL